MLNYYYFFLKSEPGGKGYTHTDDAIDIVDLSFLDHEPPKSSIHGRWGDGCLFPGYVSFNLVMRNACGIDIMSLLLLRIRFREIGSFDLMFIKMGYLYHISYLMDVFYFIFFFNLLW